MHWQMMENLKSKTDFKFSRVLHVRLMKINGGYFSMWTFGECPMCAERQIKWINVFLADDVIILAPDELYASCLKENKMLPKNYINEKQWQKRVKEFMVEEVFY